MSVRVRWQVYIMSIMIIVISGVAGVMAWSIAIKNNGKIVDNVVIGGFDAGGLTAEEAKEGLQKYWQEKFTNLTIEVYGDNEKFSINAKDIDLRLAIDGLTEKAMNAGRSGSWGECFYTYYLCLNNKYEIPLDISVDIGKLKKILIANGIEKITTAPQDAYLEQKDGKVILFAEKIGCVIDYQKIVFEIKEQLSQGQINDVKVKLSVKEEQPKITNDDLLNINSVLATYTTILPDIKSNRTHNVELAAEKVNRILLKPDEVFSFNRVVGLRSKENGYSMAATISDGNVVNGWGGGVCQVSSTLYNAVLLAGLSIIERSNHGVPVGYVPLGQDATVVDGEIDFRFKNIFLQSIYILSNIEGDRLTISILGNVGDKNNRIAIINEKTIYSPQVIIRKDPNMHIGSERVIDVGAEGFSVKVFRSFQDDSGNEVKREEISEDELSPKDRIIVIGTNGNIKK